MNQQARLQNSKKPLNENLHRKRTAAVIEKVKRASGPTSGDLRGCQAANLPAEAGLRLHGPID